jgi:putative nucleotidyltransferase with HDIG domain
MLLFVVLIGIATMFPIPDPHGGYIMATPVLFYVLFSVHEPGAAMLIAGIAYATGAAASLGWLPWRVIFNGAQIGVSVAVAGTVFRWMGGTTNELKVFSFLVPMFLAALVHQFANNFFVAAYYSRLRGLPLFSTWFSGLRDLLVSNLLSVPSAILLAALYVLVHPLTLLLYLVSLPAQRWALQLYLEHRKIHGQAIDSLVVAIDANFPQGRGHSRRVANIATAIARRLNLSESTVEGVELGALLHDVGLIGLEEDENLLSGTEKGSQPGRFREHARIGADVARELPRKDVADIVLYHHEKFDGTGYPDGLRGEKIPLGARVVALAEVYDSLVSGGFPQSKNLSQTDVMNEIRSQAGRAFDPRVVDAFLEAIKSDAIERTASEVQDPQVSRDLPRPLEAS